MSLIMIDLLKNILKYNSKQLETLLASILIITEVIQLFVWKHSTTES